MNSNDLNDAVQAGFQVDSRPDGRQRQLRLSGNLGADSVPALLAEVRTLSGVAEPVVLDWSAASFISAPALQVLLVLRAELLAAGRSLAVASDQPDIRGFLALAGLSESFPTVGGAI